MTRVIENPGRRVELHALSGGRVCVEAVGLKVEVEVVDDADMRVSIASLGLDELRKLHGAIGRILSGDA